jgi:hypothetical protein
LDLLVGGHETDGRPLFVALTACSKGILVSERSPIQKLMYLRFCENKPAKAGHHIDGCYYASDGKELLARSYKVATLVFRSATPIQMSFPTV